MKQDTTGPRESGYIHSTPEGIRPASKSPADQGAPKRRRRGLFLSFAWAAGLSILVASIGYWFYLHEIPEPLVEVLFVAFFLPTVLICETLGLGRFEIFGHTTIPDWVLFTGIGVLLYLYSLVLVWLAWGIWSWIKALLRLKKNSLTKSVAG